MSTGVNQRVRRSQFPPFELVQTALKGFGLPRDDVDTTELNGAFEAVEVQSAQEFGTILRPVPTFLRWSTGMETADGYGWYGTARFLIPRMYTSSEVVVLFPWMLRQNFRKAGTHLDRYVAVYATRDAATTVELRVLVAAITEAFRTYQRRK